MLKMMMVKSYTMSPDGMNSPYIGKSLEFGIGVIMRLSITQILNGHHTTTFAFIMNMVAMAQFHFISITMIGMQIRTMSLTIAICLQDTITSA